MSRSLRKSWVAKSNVARTGPNLPPDIFQDGLCREDEEPALVYRDDGAVEAVVQAPAAGLDISDQVQRAVVFEAGVAIERGQPGAARSREIRRGTLEDWIRPPAASVDPLEGSENRARVARSRVKRPSPLDGLDEVDQRDLVFPTDHRVCRVLQQILRVDRSVEAEEADVACRVDLTDQLGRASAETQSRVHRHRDPDEPSAPDALSVKLLHRDIHPGRRVPRLLEERDRLGEADRLVAELVTRDQQNRARL